MRKIKFRAWDKKRKKIIRFDKFNSLKIGVEKGKSWWWVRCDKRNTKILLEDINGELMQFIGLKDKNGKEIYEGDIVETFNSKRKKLIAGIWEVVFTKHLGCFDGKRVSNRKEDSGEDFECIGNLVSDKCEVIGNIYENPELLEEQK